MAPKGFCVAEQAGSWSGLAHSENCIVDVARKASGNNTTWFIMGEQSCGNADEAGQYICSKSSAYWNCPCYEQMKSFENIAVEGGAVFKCCWPTLQLIPAERPVWWTMTHVRRCRWRLLPEFSWNSNWHKKLPPYPSLWTLICCVRKDVFVLCVFLQGKKFSHVYNSVQLAHCRKKNLAVVSLKSI